MNRKREKIRYKINKFVGWNLFIIEKHGPGSVNIVRRKIDNKLRIFSSRNSARKAIWREIHGEFHK